MKAEILEIVKNNPRNFSRIIKSTPDMYNLIKYSHGETVSEKIYNWLYAVDRVCQLNQARKWKSFSQGYGFCGTSAKCSCAKQSVSNKVSQSKRQYSDEKKQEITKQRQLTTQEKYGVANVGQTPAALRQHAKVYADQQRSLAITQQVKNTKLELHGCENYNNSEQIQQTWKTKSNTDYWHQVYPEKHVEQLHNAELLKKLYTQMSIPQLAEHCNVHIQTVYKYLNKHNLRDPFSSSEEQEVVRFLESIGITNIVRNTRKLLPSRREIDIYLPDYKVAIEYNGVYWHHEDVNHITKQYHYEKFAECEQLGIQLLTVFSNFWKQNPQRVQQIIINRLGLDRRCVYARKCTVKEITSRQARTFFQDNHVQGYSVSSVRYGLFYNDQLTAAMTFSKTRVGIGSGDNGWELVRFASNTRVAGGAGKLLSAFVKQYCPQKVISYSDNEWSNGNLYNTLGFELISNIPPSYWYVKPKEERFYHRYNFAKHKLVEKGFDPALTEKQITKNMGLLKVWDCGKKKWVLTVNKESTQ